MGTKIFRMTAGEERWKEGERGGRYMNMVVMGRDLGRLEEIWFGCGSREKDVYGRKARSHHRRGDRFNG